jgi:hypothetical protein
MEPMSTHCPKCNAKLMRDGNCLECIIQPVTADPLAVMRDTMAKMIYNHKAEMAEAARLITRLLRYANRVAERHPQAVTRNGQGARADAGIWLAAYEKTLIPPCHDCGRPSTGELLMNTTVVGDYQYLCADCREENDPENVMHPPCPNCHGSGREVEGWDCEYCDGLGTDDF